MPAMSVISRKSSISSRFVVKCSKYFRSDGIFKVLALSIIPISQISNCKECVPPIYVDAICIELTDVLRIAMSALEWQHFLL